MFPPFPIFYLIPPIFSPYSDSPFHLFSLFILLCPTRSTRSTSFHPFILHILPFSPVFSHYSASSPLLCSLLGFFLPISSPYIFWYTSSWFHSLIQLLLYFLYFFSHSICLELYQKRLFSLFYHISLPVFPPLFCFFSISFTFCPILFAWKFTRNCFFHFFT